jgi:hypothetical protein
MKYRYADDPRIYPFIDRLYSLPNNNPITGFGSVTEITTYLREQWAGLFQRYLNQQLRMKEVAIVEDMRGIAATLREMVDFLSTSNQDKDEALRSILLTNHPIFARLAKLTKTGYRVYFTTHDEMKAWLEVRNFRPADREMYSNDSVEEWYNDKTGWIEFKKEFFNVNGSLKHYAASDWDDEWIKFTAPAKPESNAPTTNRAGQRPRSAATSITDDDDIPF